MRIFRLLMVLSALLLLVGCQEKQNLKLAEEYINNIYDRNNYTFQSTRLSTPEDALKLSEDFANANTEYHSLLEKMDERLVFAILNWQGIGEPLKVVEQNYTVSNGIEGTEVIIYKFVIERYDSHLEIVGNIIFNLDGSITGHYIIGVEGFPTL